MQIRTSLLYFFLFIPFCVTLSQETGRIIPLKQILEKIANQHQVNFNYIEGEITIFNLREPNENLPLEKKITYLKEATQLQFSVVNKKYYNIINDKRLDKPLCGYLIDIETNKAIENANIKIIETTISTRTNENGYFEIPAASPNKISISHINYHNTQISPQDIYKIDCPKVFLQPKITELEEIVTLTYLTKGITKKTDGSIAINPKQIGHLPGLTEPDVFKTLQQVPGVISVDESISNINIRGGTHDQNLVIWNGIRLFQTGHFFGMISALNPNLTHKIKLIKNGSSAIYGESTSSIIDISTHTDEIENNKGAAGFNWINADGYTKLKTGKKSNLEISGRRSFTDILKNSPTYKSYSNRIFQNTEVTNTSNNKDLQHDSQERFYFYDITAQYHQKIGKNTALFVDAILISNKLDLTQNKIENNNNITRNSFLKQNTYGSSIHFKTFLNTNNQVQTTAYGSFYTIDSKNESIENNQIFNQANDIIDLGFKIHNTNTTFENIKLVSGYQFNEIGIRNVDQINSPVFYRKIKDVLKNHALILESDYISKNKKLKANLGLRANYFIELYKLLLEPRLQFNYKLTQSLSLEILGEQKNQTTSQIIDHQKDFLGIEKRRWILSNEQKIPIMQSEQASIGLLYKENKWLITLENFYKKVRGITSMSQGFQNQLEFETINGNYTTVGTEVLIQKQIQHFTTWISYSLSNNNYDFKTFSPQIFPNNFEIKHNATFATIYDNQKIKLALGAKFHTGKPTTIPKNEKPLPTNPKIIYNKPNSDNLENYFQLNFSASYCFFITKKSNLNTGLALENITNQKNTINQFYRVNENTETIERIRTFSLERTLNAYVRYTF